MKLWLGPMKTVKKAAFMELRGTSRANKPLSRPTQ
jgi:hypothetical protein